MIKQTANKTQSRNEDRITQEQEVAIEKAPGENQTRESEGQNPERIRHLAGDLREDFDALWPQLEAGVRYLKDR